MLKPSQGEASQSAGRGLCGRITTLTPCGPALLFALSLLAQPGHAKTITHDTGGEIYKYVIQVNRLIARGERVRIDGYCGSACTLHLLNPKTCITTRGTLAFHAASNEHGTHYLMAVYPAKVTGYIKRHGGLTKRLIIAHGWEAQKLARPCGD